MLCYLLAHWCVTRRWYAIAWPSALLKYTHGQLVWLGLYWCTRVEPISRMVWSWVLRWTRGLVRWLRRIALPDSTEDNQKDHDQTRGPSTNPYHCLPILATLGDHTKCTKRLACGSKSNMVVGLPIVTKPYRLRCGPVRMAYCLQVATADNHSYGG